MSRRLFTYTLEEFERLIAHGPVVMKREKLRYPEEDEQYIATLFIAMRQGKRQYIYREDFPERHNDTGHDWGETWGDTLLEVLLKKMFGWEYDTCILVEAERTHPTLALASKKRQQ